MLSAEDAGDTGWRALNDSILACNKSDWDSGKELAKSAETNFQTMRDGYGQAAAVVPDCPEVAGACPYADGYLELARGQYDPAVRGAKGSINGYNSQIEKLETLKQQVDELSSLAALAASALWEGADGVYGHFQLEATDANRAWTEAKDMVAAGEV
jgi:hypothetical protein